MTMVSVIDWAWRQEGLWELRPWFWERLWEVVACGMFFVMLRHYLRWASKIVLMQHGVIAV